MAEVKILLNKVNNKWVRLVALIVVVLNGGFKMFGVELLPFDNEEIVSGISFASIVVVGAWSFWKDNPFSEWGKKSNNYMNAIKKNIKEQREAFKQDVKDRKRSRKQRKG